MPTRSDTAAPAHTFWLPILLGLTGIGLRLLRLEWQPLWWDEGYSVYFATESLAEMLRLTAQDIHPPLYYALLHGWLTAFGSASPLLLRTFSVLVGVLALPVLWWLARLFYPSRRRVGLLALLLLALSPIHIFYSQEVRMYGLEMLLGMVSTGLFWQIASDGRRTALKWVGYVAATAALLYTEYYAVLLPFVHFVWALWLFRPKTRGWLPLIGAWIAVVLAWLPWLLYAVPELIPYVSQKIVEDGDRPLGLAAYALRHLLAFTTGHIPPPTVSFSVLRWLALLALILLLSVYLLSLYLRRSRRSPLPAPHSPLSFLCLLLLIPPAAGFALNLRLPFFPEGGERVLLFILPYFLLLVAAGLDGLSGVGRGWMRALAGAILTALLAGAGAGIWTFYTVPRYTDDDYRPLIRQTVQQGGETDTVLAVFPWQIGYWRAYAPVWTSEKRGREDLHGPWPLLSPSPAWGRDVQNAIDDALAQGKLWFPAHLSLGGILEGEIEGYLAGGASPPTGKATVNFENRWYSPTTRLSGWAWAEKPSVGDAAADFTAVQLRAAGLGADTVASANEVLAVGLGWSQTEAQELRVSLRLEDGEGRVWAQRDYAPLGSWRPAESAPGGIDQIGLLIPPGVPPGPYRVAVGVGPAEDDWLYTATASGVSSDVATIGALQIAGPKEPLPVLRLPVQIPLTEPVTRDGINFLGASGFDPAVATLAGAEMNLSIFVEMTQRQSASRELYVSVLDSRGDGVAGWEGWPLPAYPLESWPPGTQMRLPVRFYLPASLSPGDYRLVAGLREAETGQKSVPVRLGLLPVVRRDASFASPQPQYLLDEPALFGAHATLLGYDRDVGEDGSIHLTFYWRVEQTLLPPHNVFVHLRDGSDILLAQDDGVPGRKQTAAPSNTWTPGEIIADPHTLSGPASLSPGVMAQVGLYDPVNGVRLPVSVKGETIGDTYSVALDSP